MWYLSHLAGDLGLDDDRAGTFSVDALMGYNRLFFHRKISFRQVSDVQNSVVELFVNITRAMFANGPIHLDEIWANQFSPKIYWGVSEIPGM